eukprot:8858552-Pyramimonas_sp.AAC.1
MARTPEIYRFQGGTHVPSPRAFCAPRTDRPFRGKNPLQGSAPQCAHGSVTPKVRQTLKP